jgi:DNA-binding CsgD family transcriptional regulator
MAKFDANGDGDHFSSLPPPPLDPAHLEAIYDAMRLSPQQRTIVDLTIRGLTDGEIAHHMGIDESTIGTQRERIALRTGARTRMQIAMHVLRVSHEVKPHDRRR